MKDLCGDGNVLCLEYSNANILVELLCCSYQEVTNGENWVKGTQDLTVLFLRTCNYLKIKSLIKNKRHHKPDIKEGRGV